MVPKNNTTDRYQPALDSIEIGRAIYVLFDGPTKAKDLADELGVHTSTASIMLQALKRDDLVEKDKWMYRLDEDELYGEFVLYLMNNIQDNLSYTATLFEEHEDDIFSHPDIRTHLMKFLKTALQSNDEKSVRDLFQKYRDNLSIRHQLNYILHQLDEDTVLEEKKTFYQYVTVLQGILQRAAWTESRHALALANQLVPEEDYPDRFHEIQTLEDVEGKVAQTACTVLEDMTDDERIGEIRIKEAKNSLTLYDKALLAAILETDETSWQRDRLEDLFIDYCKEHDITAEERRKQHRRTEDNLYHLLFHSTLQRLLFRRHNLLTGDETIKIADPPGKEGLRNELNINISEEQE